MKNRVQVNATLKTILQTNLLKINKNIKIIKSIQMIKHLWSELFANILNSLIIISEQIKALYLLFKKSKFSFILGKTL